MGILNNLFQSNEKKIEIESFNWISLNEISQLEELIKVSNSNLVVIFKHSTRCWTSRSVLSKFEKATVSLKENVAFYYLDLLNYRNISNEITQKFNVRHQSPQIVVLKDGKVVDHQSHYDIISTLNLKGYV